jgi:hypothetical protein
VNGPGVRVRIGHWPRYYNYYARGVWGTRNGCPPHWTTQGGACEPHRYGPVGLTALRV